MGTTSPDEFWFSYFERRNPDSEDVTKLVHTFHEAKRYDQVIAVINAALANSQSQPWMFDILGLAMKLDNRPEKEIERAILSPVDFTTTDVPGLLYSAAFLTRLEANSQALRMYRQASELSPTRPEPYVLSLKLAKQARDYEAIQWACSGILTYVWTKDRAQRHKESEDVASEAEAELRKAGKDAEADRLKQAVASAKQRDLIIRIEWTGTGDLDLSVEEPMGAVCSIFAPMSPGGGVLLHDGYGPKPENCYDEYVCAMAASGTYRARVNFVDGKIVGGKFRVTIIRRQGTALETVKSLTVPLDKAEKVIRITLNSGRRQKPLLLPEGKSRPAGSRTMSRQQLIAQLRQGGRAGGRRAPQPPAGFRMPAGSFTSGIGFQPIIGLINEGVSLTAQAVVSADRRYVRIAVAPMFNTLIDMQTFSFQGGAPQGQGGGQGQAPAGGQGQ